MQKSMGRFLTAAVVVALGSPSGCGGGNRETPKPVPPKLVRLWRDAGADAWWTSVSFQDDAGMSSAGQVLKDKDDMGKGFPGQLPVFRFSGSVWRDGIVPKLPDPGVPFAIEATNDPKINDDSLKDMAGLKSLRWLNLSGGLGLTGVGFKDLTELKGLRLLMRVQPK